MSTVVEVRVPDIGDFESVEVIEVLVKPGDLIAVDQSLVTVESDKASMEIPSSAAGVVRALRVNLGDKVKQGSVLLEVESSAATAASAAIAAPVAALTSAAAAVATPVATPVAKPAAAPAPLAAPVTGGAPDVAPVIAAPGGAGSDGAGQRAAAHAPGAADMIVNRPHASPSVRLLARELGVDLVRVSGTGPKQRITPEDVRAYVKVAVATAMTLADQADAVRGSAPAGLVQGGGAISLAAMGGRELANWPKVDFAKFGPVEEQALSRIKKLSGANLHRNWVAIPHVTNHDEADITELEVFRNVINKENEKRGIKLTMLAFLIQACVSALKKFPEFNASLDGDRLILKRYFHIGFAADTPNGLVVPVIRDADRKGVLEIAQETSALAAKARDGKLAPAEMQGGCFSISSLGGIGGTYFTPIINAPEVAILGVCKSQTRPVWDGKQFVPRLMLPLSLSWDHRVIDGAAAARFNAYLGQLLADFRRTLL
jgi:pyruvate dehydrogenase E2 component (dihydrolipoamide acetyltransferase)